MCIRVPNPLKVHIFLPSIHPSLYPSNAYLESITMYEIPCWALVFCGDCTGPGPCGFGVVGMQMLDSWEAPIEEKELGGQRANQRKLI